MKEKIDIYREGIASCTKPIGKFVNDQAATFTMALCAPTRDEAWETARESFEWYPKAGARQIGSVAELDGGDADQELGNYAYAADMEKHRRATGSLDLLKPRVSRRAPARACSARPRSASRRAARYEAAGVDLLLCLVNPYKIAHEHVMQTIELMGTHVIPQFSIATSDRLSGPITYEKNRRQARPTRSRSDLPWSRGRRVRSRIRTAMTRSTSEVAITLEARLVSRTFRKYGQMLISMLSCDLPSLSQQLGRAFRAPREPLRACG